MQHPLIEEYIAEIAPPRGGGPVETDGDAVELSQHLSALADAHAEFGLTEDEAAREAIRQFGAARYVRRDLKRIRLRGRLLEQTRTSAGVVIVVGGITALTAFLATCAVNAIMLPETILATTRINGHTWNIAALIAGAILGARRGRRALTLAPSAACFAAALPFIVGLPLTWGRAGGSTTSLVISIAAFFLWRSATMSLHAVVGALVGSLWRRKQRGALHAN